MTCRILIDEEPHAGPWNMAVDEVLLQRAAEGDRCTVRSYRWSEATVSLGHFQTLGELQPLPELSLLPCVRRLSGGGAIVHQHEWTYSCTVPASHPLAKSRDVLYQRIHERIRRVLREQGFGVDMRGPVAGGQDGDQEAVLCFDRQDARDLLFQGCKILGSAQRRRRGAVLQHGSLLLNTSPHAPQFPGLWDLAVQSGDHREPPPPGFSPPERSGAGGPEGVAGPPPEWGELLASAVGSVFSTERDAAPLTRGELQRAATVEHRYHLRDPQPQP